MKKNIIKRGLLGFVLGITLGYIITIMISVTIGDGNYYACVPELVEAMGSNINAVVLQTILSGILGTAYALCSFIWEIDRWSIAKQSGIYFMIISLVNMPIAYILNWMDHSVKGCIIYFAIFLMIFIFVWIAQYLAWKKKIKQMNSKLKD